MFMCPALELLALVPGCSIPDNDQDALALTTSYSQQSLQHQDDLVRVGLAIAEVQKAITRVLAHSTKTGQGFVRFLRLGLALYQSQFFSFGCPAAHPGLGKSAEPTLILVHQQPIGV
jgi:hypothetical protein